MRFNCKCCGTSPCRYPAEEVAKEIVSQGIIGGYREDYEEVRFLQSDLKKLIGRIAAALKARDKENEERVKVMRDSWLMMLDEMIEKINHPEWREVWGGTKKVLSSHAARVAQE